jgi:transcriptional regulator of acetoin/glycerol metabolism
MLSEGSLISDRELSGAYGIEGTGRAGEHFEFPGRPHVAEPPAALDDIEREHIVEILTQVRGNRTAAAKLLGISRRALYRRLERHHIAEETPTSK